MLSVSLIQKVSLFQFYMNVGGHQAGHFTPVLKGQVNASQAEFERVALAQVAELWSN